jgi:hypothetical protein
MDTICPEQSVSVAELSIHIQKATAGFQGKSLHGAVESFDLSLIQPRYLEGNKTVYDNICRWKGAAQGDNDLLYRLAEIVIFHKKIIGAGHDQYNVRISDLFLDSRQSVQKSLCRFTGNTEVDDGELSYPFLPVKIGQEGITEKE